MNRFHISPGWTLVVPRITSECRLNFFKWVKEPRANRNPSLANKIAHVATFAHLKICQGLYRLLIGSGWTLVVPRLGSVCRLNFFKWDKEPCANRNPSLAKKIEHVATFSLLKNFQGLYRLLIGPGWTLVVPRKTSGCRLNCFKWVKVPWANRNPTLAKKIAHPATFAHLKNFLGMYRLHIGPCWTLVVPRKA